MIPGWPARVDPVALLQRVSPATGQDQDAIAERCGRLIWAVLAEPGDRIAGALVADLGALAALALLWPAAETSTSGADAREYAARAALRVGARYRELGRTDLPDGISDAVARWLPRMREEAVLPSLLMASVADARLLTPVDPEWPRALDDLGPHAPFILWCRGSARLLGLPRPAVTIVGSRANTGYGAHVAAELAAGVAERGHAVVSGGAYGIDAIAHRAALAVRGATIAVMAGGPERLYPAGNTELLERIIAGGLLLSESPFGREPSRWRFLARNRLLAALGAVTVVVEAGVRSGTLNTAHHAGALGRPLGAVPGPVTSPSSAGCHELMRTDGAACITDVGDVLDLAGLARPAAVVAAVLRHDPEAVRVLDALSARRARTAAELAQRSGLPIDGVRTVLGLLASQGQVVQTPQGWVSRVPSASR